MVDNDTLRRLFDAFPRGFINHNLEFIALPKVNSYFILGNCEITFDVSCKLLEWLSREACCSLHYRTQKANEEIYKYHTDGINKFLGTQFTRNDMIDIYTHLGNCCNHQKTIDFISSGYDMDVLTKEHYNR